MAEIRDISHCEVVPLAVAINEKRDYARSRLMKGGRVVLPRPMMWDCNLISASAAHVGEHLTPDIDVYFVRNAVVGGRGSLLIKDDAYLYGMSSYPAYVKEFIETNITPERWAFSAPMKKYLKRGYLLIHFNDIWGHWLTEALPKLFVIKLLGEQGLTAPIVLPSTAAPYIFEIIKDILPGQQVITYDAEVESISIDLSILPSMLQVNYIFHDYLRESLESYARNIGKGESEAIFISRQGMKTLYSYREMENEREIETIAMELGLRIVEPETMSWNEQVRLFSNAYLVVGEFGSGLHNAILSSRGTKVVCINWIVELQSRIANFRGHDVGYILPEDGVPRGFSLNQSLQKYHVNPNEFRNLTQIAMERTRSSSEWRYEDVPVISSPYHSSTQNL